MMLPLLSRLPVKLNVLLLRVAIEIIVGILYTVREVKRVSALLLSRVEMYRLSSLSLERWQNWLKAVMKFMLMLMFTRLLWLKEKWTHLVELFHLLIVVVVLLEPRKL